MNYLSQEFDTSCVAVAIINACKYLQMDEPDLEKLKDHLCCRGGEAIGVDKVIGRVFGRKLVRSLFSGIMKSGGLLTILHPICNFHMTLCYPEEEGYTWINSWLGPNVMKNLSENEISRFLPKFVNQRECWKFNDLFVGNNDD